MLTNIIIALIPVLQLGYSFYVSVATLIFVLCLVNWWPVLRAGWYPALPYTWMGALLLLPMLSVSSSYPAEDSLRLLREAIMFVILCCTATGIRYVDSRYLPAAPVRLITALLAGLLVLVVIQAVLFPRGIYFGFPENWFSQESGTIATAEALRFGAETLRPHATFSEPSFLGFILISISLILAPRLGTSRAALGLLALILVIGLMSRSLSFLFSVALVIILPLAVERSRNRGLAIGVIITGLVMMLAATSAGSLLSRLASAGSASTADYSTGIRVFVPLQTLPDYLLAYPLGAPDSVVEHAMLPFLPNFAIQPGEILNTALFNLFFVHGLVALPILAATFLVARDLRTRTYLLVSLFFNGTFFVIDKVSVFILVMTLYEQALRQQRRIVAEAPTAPRSPPTLPSARAQ